MKKGTKRDKSAFSGTEVGALIEGLRAEFRVFGEDLTSVKNRLDMLFEELGKQKEDTFVIRVDIRIIKSDIAEIKENLKDHGKRLTQLEAIK